MVILFVTLRAQKPIIEASEEPGIFVKPIKMLLFLMVTFLTIANPSHGDEVIPCIKYIWFE